MNDYRRIIVHQTSLFFLLALTLLAVNSSRQLWQNEEPKTISVRRAALETGPIQEIDSELRGSIAKHQEETSVAQLPKVGSLGPKGTNRRHYHYYDSLYYTALQYGADAKSVLEVGCVADAFIQHLYWIDQKDCVAPFSAYGDEANSATNVNLTIADFNEWQVPASPNTSTSEQQQHQYPFDLLVSSQVVEHVPNPREFVQKFFQVAPTVIFSVPHQWPAKFSPKTHKTHNIDLDMLLGWAKPHKPVATSIVRDKSFERIIVVFSSAPAAASTSKS